VKACIACAYAMEPAEEQWLPEDLGPLCLSCCMTLGPLELQKLHLRLLGARDLREIKDDKGRVIGVGGTVYDPDKDRCAPPRIDARQVGRHGPFPGSSR
jgi:hypothetical protein